jgi:hypothetical protein
VVVVVLEELYTKEHFLLPAELAYQYQLAAEHRIKVLTDQTAQLEPHPHLVH